MKKAVWSAAVTAAAVLCLSTPSFGAAADRTATTVTVEVAAKAGLALGATSSALSGTNRTAPQP